MSDRPALRPSVAVGEALRGVAHDILAEARGAIEDPARSEAEAVHDFRRAMKRWRALLRLLEAFVGPDDGAYATRRATSPRSCPGRATRNPRLDALDDLKKHGLALSPRSTQPMRGRIEDIRRSAETTLDAEMRGRLAGALDEAPTRWSAGRSLRSPEAVADELSALLPRSAPPADRQTGRRPRARSCTSCANAW